MNAPADFLRVPAAELKEALIQIMDGSGFPALQAQMCAEVFIGNSLDGVHSHGVNRFSKFMSLVHEGRIQPAATAVCRSRAGGIEQWDGQLGPGPVNALNATDRAVALAAEYGIGCVALANTNHWLRGGTYGWRAARAGFVFIGWSNTIANMPAWGAVNSKLGNNPLVMAIPYEHEAIVLDMAMSQYSYGALEVAQMKGARLPVPGGYDSNGVLTTDPEEIRKSQRALPVGFWKGAGLSLMLDVLATVLSGGLSTAEISRQKSESNLSQIFIAIALNKLANYRTLHTAIHAIIQDYRQSVPIEPGTRIRYPGEDILKIRAENEALGIPLAFSVWEEIKKLRKIP